MSLRNVYPCFLQEALTGGVNIDTHPIRAILVNDYSFRVTHRHLSEVVATEVVNDGPTLNPPGYTAGGAAIENVAMVQQDGAVVLLADDLIFPEMTISRLDGIIFYLDSGDPSTSVLIAHEHFFDQELDNARLFFRFPNSEFMRLRLEDIPW